MSFIVKNGSADMLATSATASATYVVSRGLFHNSNPLQYEEVPSFFSFPKAQYFLEAYVWDVYRRLPASINDTIIKLDSTYKVCKRLQGTAANTANLTWPPMWGMRMGRYYIVFLPHLRAWIHCKCLPMA